MDNEQSVENKKQVNSFKRKLKHGSYSVVITVVFIAAAVLLNVIFGMLFGNLNLRFDLTERGLYSIEAGTAEYLSSLDDVINIYFCSTEENFTGRGIEFMQAYEIAQRFAEANKNFTISFVDRLTNPAFSAQFGGNLTDTCVVIESEKTERFRVVREPEYRVFEFFIDGHQLTEMQAYEYYMFGYGDFIETSVSAGTEQAFLSAVMSVSDLTPIRVAFTHGFGETGYSAMWSVLQANGYLVEELDMFGNAEIDPETDFVVIFSPAYDYSPDALKAISDWLDNGQMYGRNLLFFPSPQMPETPNLDDFMADEWGLRAEYGFAAQTNSSFALSPDGWEQLVRAAGEYFAEDVPERTLVATAIRPVTRLFDSRQSMDTTVLIETYAAPNTGTIYVPLLELDELDEDWDPVYEVLNVAVMSRKTRFEGFETLTSRVIMFGSPSVFVGETLMTPQLSNAQLLLNIFGDISGRSEIAARVTPKSFGSTVFDITVGQANMIAVVFVIIIPVLIITAGLVVFFRRRYR